MALIDNLADFLIDFKGNLTRYVVRRIVVTPKEHILRRTGVVLDRTQIAHTVQSNHILGNVCCPLNIVARTGRNIIEEQFLCHTAAHIGRNLPQQILLRRHQLLFLRRHQVISARFTARNDRHLLYNLRTIIEETDDCVSTLVIGDKLLRLLIIGTALLCRPHHDTVNGLINLARIDLILVITHRKNRRFIQNILKIRTRESRRTLCQRTQIHIRRHPFVPRMNIENRLSALAVRKRNRNLTIETARTQQSRIQNIRTVRRRNHDDAAVVFHTVHLNEQLVQRLFTLIMAAAEAGTTLTTNRIDFINEDDARSSCLRLLEHVTYTARTDTDKHLNKVRTRNGIERNICLTGDCLCKQRFAGARMTAQQNSLRNPRTHPLVFGRRFQISDDLLHLCLFLIAARHIAEAYLRLGLQTCPRLAEIKCLRIGRIVSAHPVHHPHAQQQNNDQRNQLVHRLHECIAGFRIHDGQPTVFQLIRQILDRLFCRRSRRSKGNRVAVTIDVRALNTDRIRTNPQNRFRNILIFERTLQLRIGKRMRRRR